MAWTVQVDDAGVVGDPLPSAVPGRYTLHNKFRPGEFTFKAKITDAVLISDLPFGDEMITRRINLYENGVLRWRGRPAPWETSIEDGEVTIRCKTAEWDFDSRFFGWAERPNLLENGGFEDWTAGSPDSWGLQGSAAVAEVASITEGTSAAKLTATDTASYLWQQEATGVDILYFPGLTAIGTAWALVVSGSVPRGTVLAELIVDGAPGTFSETWVASEDINAGSLFRVSVPLFVAGGVNWTGELRLYSINGAITWDDAGVTFGEATTVLQNGGAGEDLAVLVEHVTEYAQGAPWSDLGIAHDCPATGIMAIPGVNLAGFDHSRHEKISAAYQQIGDEYGVDIWVGLDDILHLRVKRGVRRDELAFAVDPTLLGVIATGLGITGDPSLGHNVALVVGESELFAADEAGAIDLSAFGGMTRARWEKAPSGTPPKALAIRAAEIVRVEARSPAFPVVPIHLDAGVVGIGDVIPLDIDAGWVQIPEGDYRVASIEVDPQKRVQYCQLDADDGIPLDSEAP